MTTRSEVSPSLGASLIGGVDNAMDAALAAFRQLETTTTQMTGDAFANFASAVGEYEQGRQAAQAELDELLMMAGAVNEPELRSEIYAAHDAARSSLAQGLPGGMALQHARSVRDGAINGGAIRRNADMDDADKARLAEFIAEQERYLMRLNEEARGFMTEMDAYNSDESRENVAAAEDALANAQTDEEKIEAQGRLIAAQRAATEEARTNATAALEANPDDAEAQAAVTAADGMDANIRERERALEDYMVSVYESQDMSPAEAKEKAAQELPNVLARDDVQTELTDGDDRIANSDVLRAAVMDTAIAPQTSVVVASAPEEEVGTLTAQLTTEVEQVVLAESQGF